MLLPLRQWYALHHGFGAWPSACTLATWARKGQFSPAPVKRGWCWYLAPEAVFTGPTPKNTAALVRGAIQEMGKASMRDIAEATGLPMSIVSARVGGMRAEGVTRQLYISGWRRDSAGGYYWLRALYSLGKRGDAKKPPRLPKTETQARYYQKAAGRSLNSVFALAVPKGDRRVTYRRKEV